MKKIIVSLLVITMLAASVIYFDPSTGKTIYIDDVRTEEVSKTC